MPDCIIALRLIGRYSKCFGCPANAPSRILSHTTAPLQTEAISADFKTGGLRNKMPFQFHLSEEWTAQNIFQEAARAIDPAHSHKIAFFYDLRIPDAEIHDTVIILRMLGLAIAPLSRIFALIAPSSMQTLLRHPTNQRPAAVDGIEIKISSYATEHARIYRSSRSRKHRRGGKAEASDWDREIAGPNVRDRCRVELPLYPQARKSMTILTSSSRPAPPRSLDRDSIINHDDGFISTKDRMPNAAKAIRRLDRAGCSSSSSSPTSPAWRAATTPKTSSTPS